MVANRALSVVFSLLAFITFFTPAIAAPKGDGYGGYGDYGNDGHDRFPQCNLKKSMLPQCSSQGTCLTAPPKGSKLVAVVLGVGSQNYTCSSKFPSAAPTPNGALATLYDISCTVAKDPAAASYLSALEIATGAYSSFSIPKSLGYAQVGSHFFAPDAKTPVFEIGAEDKDKHLKFVGTRLENIAAPAGSVPNSVDWLKLGRSPAHEYESKGVNYVYRVYTAGGKAPTACNGVDGALTQPYAAEYWFYN